MKTGEKRAFMAILAAFVGVIIFTIYYEILYQKREAEKQTAAATAGDQASLAQNPGIWVIPKGLNPDALPSPDSRGATMLTLYCVQCHDLPTPVMHTAEEWEVVVNRMEKEMQRRRGGVLIRVMMPPEKDWQILRSYLTDNAQQPLDESQYPDLATAAGQAFQTTCSQCHAAPDPAQHSPNEWPRVVLRMRNNISAAGLKMPDEKTVDLITGFLKAHSKQTQSTTL
jgi:hypothetical protein